MNSHKPFPWLPKIFTQYCHFNIFCIIIHAMPRELKVWGAMWKNTLKKQVWFFKYQRQFRHNVYQLVEQVSLILQTTLKEFPPFSSIWSCVSESCNRYLQEAPGGRSTAAVVLRECDLLPSTVLPGRQSPQVAIPLHWGFKHLVESDRFLQACFIYPKFNGTTGLRCPKTVGWGERRMVCDPLNAFNV